MVDNSDNNLSINVGKIVKSQGPKICFSKMRKGIYGFSPKPNFFMTSYAGVKQVGNGMEC